MGQLSDSLRGGTRRRRQGGQLRHRESPHQQVRGGGGARACRRLDGPGREVERGELLPRSRQGSRVRRSRHAIIQRNMRVRALAVLLMAIGFALSLVPAHAQDRVPERPLIQSIEFDLTINPASAEWAKKALDDAKDDGAYMVIFRLDTPGGLDDSMREIIKKILAAPMPVVVYVSPNGARAASAGLYITEAADVAAMAPQTNIGSATPVSLGGGNQDEVLGRKIRNDATAYVRALAEAHGRNADLAAEMVEKATNVPALEAKRRNLVDVIAP